MLIFFIYLYFISSLVVILGLITTFNEIDVWSLKNWFDFEVTEEELEMAKKVLIILALTPLSIVGFIYGIHTIIKEKFK